MHQSPADVWIGLLVLAVFVTVVAASSRVWFAVARRRREGIPVIAYEPRRPVPWTATEIALILAGYFFFQIAALSMVTGFLRHETDHATNGKTESKKIAASKEDSESKADDKPKEMDPLRYTELLIANVLANVLTAAATVALLRWKVSPREPREPLTHYGRMMQSAPRRSPASWSDLGLPRPTTRDLKLGLMAFAAAVIPVYGLQAVFIQFTDKRHPIVEMLQRHMSLGILAVSALAAVVVAPFVEELLFRVVLQGWLERIQMLSSTEAIEPTTPEGESIAAPEQPPVADRLMPWPIALSSLAFALAHWGHGYDPIPLFFLALMLGYLYQRTHRLWPSMVVHFILNACSLSVLWLQTMVK